MRTGCCDAKTRPLNEPTMTSENTQIKLLMIEFSYRWLSNRTAYALWTNSTEQDCVHYFRSNIKKHLKIQIVWWLQIRVAGIAHTVEPPTSVLSALQPSSLLYIGTQTPFCRDYLHGIVSWSWHHCFRFMILWRHQISLSTFAFICVSLRCYINIFVTSFWLFLTISWRRSSL